MTKIQAGSRVLTLLALASLCATFGGGCAATDAKTGLTNVHTVSPGVLVRGGQPSDLGFRTLRDDYGVRTVVNLNDSTAKTEGHVVESLGMRYVALPSNAFRPDADKVLEFLQAIRDLQSTSGRGSRGAVYVHCQHGMDRTGYAVAAYRILVDGWDADRAMAELRGHQAFPHALLFPAIEPFVRRVYQDRDALRARLTPTTPLPALTPTPAIAKADTSAAGG
jgi:protein tyrosine/serine phosphatase